MTTKKMITIPHNGPIYAKGGIMGPITTPFAEDSKTIGLLIMRQIPVNEVLPSGKQIPLTVSNFDRDNSASDEVKETEEEVAAREEAEAKEVAAKEAAEAKAVKEAEAAEKEAAEAAAEAAKEAEAAEKKEAADKQRAQQKNQQKSGADSVSKK